jgi:hypothetical protein
LDQEVFNCLQPRLRAAFGRYWVYKCFHKRYFMMPATNNRGAR